MTKESKTGFDAKKFLKTKFIPRTEEVPVPDLKDFFPEGVKPVWIVRGLTGQEIGRANEAPENFRKMGAIMEGLTSQISKENAEAIKKLIGMGADAVVDDTAKRISYLTVGSVDPPCSLDLAVHLCTHFPGEFIMLSNSIRTLSTLGHVPGKQTPSGETPKSAPASPSGTPGGDSSTN